MKTADVPIGVDSRGVRDIVLDIERRISAPPAPQAAPQRLPFEGRRSGYRRYIPSRLTREAEEAVDIVLADARAHGRLLTFDALIESCLKVAPRCGLYVAGTMNDAIRNYLAEKAGIRVMWSKGGQ